MIRKSLLLLLDRDSDTGPSITHGCRQAGWDVTTRWRDEYESWQGNLTDCQSLLIYGPHNGSFWPVAQRLLQLPLQKRPRVIWWLCENSPHVNTPRMLNRALATAAWTLDRTRDRFPANWRTATPLRQFDLGHRHRILGELLAFHRHRLVDRLVVTSRHRADYLARMGLKAMTVPLGYDPVYGVDLQRERSVDLLFLGRLAGRRLRLWSRIESSLSRCQVRIEVVDGKTRSVVNETRTELLNRTRILLNLLQAPGDWTGHRLLLGMANGALVVTEPLADHGPFRTGTHLVEAPPEQLAEQILYYLRNEASRLQIAAQARAFIQSDLAMPNLCNQVLGDSDLSSREQTPC